MNWYLSTGRLSTLYLFQLQTPLCHVSPLPHLFTPLYHQSQSTIHIVPLVGNRQKHLMPRSVLLCVPNGSLFTPGHPSLWSESSYLNHAKLLHHDPFQKPKAEHTKCQHPPDIHLRILEPVTGRQCCTFAKWSNH